MALGGTTKVQNRSGEVISPTPDWPTTLRRRLTGGRCEGVDGSMWLFHKANLAPVLDAREPIDAYKAALPLIATVEEIAAATATRGKVRQMSRAAYREVQILLVNVPRIYVPPADHPNAVELHSSFRHIQRYERLLLVGVRLRDRLGGSDEGNLRSYVNSITQNLFEHRVPVSDFDADWKLMRDAFSRAGLTVPTESDFHLANSWWNSGYSPDIPLLIESDHVHAFTRADALNTAARMVEDKVSCEDWPEFPGTFPLSFGVIEEYENRAVLATSADALYIPNLLANGAAAVSVRAFVEPAKITRGELRRNRAKAIRDITERMEAGKMDHGEQEMLLDNLSQAESAYATDNPPASLIEVSTVIAFTGKDPHRGYDLSGIGNGIMLNSMVNRQEAAWYEMMLASDVRANPHLHDLPSTKVACSGLPSLSVVGDKDGALVGFTERDRQPAYLSPTAASTADGLPMGLVVSQTGGGKLTRLSTIVPIPGGWTTMGELAVGDQVFGRDGKPCRVTSLSPVNETPDLYRITFDDGQTAVIDADHQWVMSGFYARNGVRHPSRTEAILNYEQAHRLAESIDSLSLRTDPSDTDTLGSLLRRLQASFKGIVWKTEAGLMAALDAVDTPYSIEILESARNYGGKTDPAVLFPVAASLRANIAVWSSLTGSNAIRWGEQAAVRVAAAEAVLAEVSEADEATAPEIIRRLVGHGAVAPNPAHFRSAARAAGAQSRKGFAEVRIPLPAGDHATHQPNRVYTSKVALKSLAMRIRQQYDHKPSADAGERVVMTREMLSEGLRVAGGQANFATRVAAPFQLPERTDLAVHPYVLGAWLGDGCSHSGVIFQGTAESCTDPRGVTDQFHMIEQIKSAGYDAIPHPARAHLNIGVQKLCADLRLDGVLLNKHIPTKYQRASVEQRMALLQGLMDTDGSIMEDGGCELSLCLERLADDALVLIRGLGMKASMTSGPAVITEDDLDHPGEKRRRITGTRWRIRFTTDQTVFRLPRKMARVKETVRETQRWLYVTSIEPVPTEPGRCITVDSADSTYVIESGIPTHNTQLLLWLAHQFGKAKRPVVIFDPKIESDHTIPVLLSGGQVASLDDLISADGVFDPLRFAATPDIGIEMATSMLLSVNPWGLHKDDYEVEISSAIKYGVARGATCTGQALQLAREAQHEGLPMFPTHMIDQVFKLANSSSLFRAIVGMDPQTKPLSVSDGITLIKVGRTHLDMPSEGAAAAQLTLTQRITLALIRMVVLGSAMAMAGKDGVLLIDEFWTVLTGGATEVDRLGRVARSQRVLPIGFTQKVSDALDANLAGYISRGFIGPFQDEEQAIQACRLFKLDPSPERIGRMTGDDTIGGSDGVGAPNFNSFRALRDPRTGNFVRGAVFIYSDLTGRAVPVEVTIPSWFIKVGSTNPKDIDRRTAIFNEVKLEWPGATDLEVAWEVVRRLSPHDEYAMSVPRPDRYAPIPVPVEEMFPATPGWVDGYEEGDLPLALREGDENVFVD